MVATLMESATSTTGLNIVRIGRGGVFGRGEETAEEEAEMSH